MRISTYAVSIPHVVAVWLFNRQFCNCFSRQALLCVFMADKRTRSIPELRRKELKK